MKETRMACGRGSSETNTLKHIATHIKSAVFD